MEGYRTQTQYLYGALSGQTPVDRFRMAGDAYVRFALDHPRYYEILYSYTQFLGIEELPEEIGALIRTIHQFWLDRVRECMDAGILRPGDPDLVGRSFWAMTHGMISIYQRKMLCVPEEEFRTAYVEAIRHLIEGVGARQVPESHLAGTATAEDMRDS
jgi:AcrR family transcriptional regulator